jgi:DNA-binding NtrC family response regulator
MPFAEYPMIPKRPVVLIVEPDGDRRSRLMLSLPDIATVFGYGDFHAARSRLAQQAPQLLITNVRLGEYNGIHLVRLASSLTRCIVYMEPEDPCVLREAQRAGAVVESFHRLPLSIVSYLAAGEA